MPGFYSRREAPGIGVFWHWRESLLDGGVRRQLLFPVSDNYSSLSATITLFP